VPPRVQQPAALRIAALLNLTIGSFGLLA